MTKQNEGFTQQMRDEAATLYPFKRPERKSDKDGNYTPDTNAYQHNQDMISRRNSYLSASLARELKL